MTIDPATLKIVLYPQPVLRQRAIPIETIDETVRAVAARMIELMHDAEGIGLAAPQVGLSWRMFVCRGLDEGDPDRVFINPRLTLHPGPLVPHEEGCLSLPEITAQIRRPAQITIEALDLDGVSFCLEDDEMPARVWQHENDHLDGVLIIDRMMPIDRLATRKAIKALESA